MTEDDEILICIDCVKEIRFKKLIERNDSIKRCTCCGSDNYTIDVDSNEFIQMTKALVRYHFSEWDYNTHWGGDGFCTLFTTADNIFFDKSRFTNDEIYDEFINRVECCKVYEDYEKGVSIFAGYYEGEQNPLLQSIKSDYDTSIIETEELLKNENYFNFEEKLIKIISEYKSTSKITVKKGEEFYRARIGIQDKKRSVFGGGFEGEMIFVPYSNSQIGAPPPYLAGFGRINRAGVSFLYSATDKYTAISEIRPHPGDFVSVGKFITKRDLLIFDLTEKQFLDYYQTDEKLDEFKKLNTLTELMQKVIPPSERQSYNITQLIADCIRKLEFDGILFPSSVGNGHNLVVFNPANMNYTYDSAEVVQVREVNYDYFQRNWKKDITEIE